MIQPFVGSCLFIEMGSGWFLFW